MFFSSGSYFAFNQGDTLDISFNSKKTIVSLQIYEIDTINLSNFVILKEIKDTVNSSFKIVISKKTILGFVFSSQQKNNIEVKIYRTPTSIDGESFITAIKWIEKPVFSDSKIDNSELITSEWQNVVTNSIVSCNSRTKIGGSTRNVVPISPIPKNTFLLVYRIVCNNENHKENAENTNDLLSELSDINPTTAVASLILKTINKVPGTAICDIYLLRDVEGRDNFLKKNDDGDIVDCIKSYSVTGINNHNQVIKDIDFNNLFLGFRNIEITSAVDISVNVVAAVKVKKWKYTIKIPRIEEDYQQEIIERQKLLEQKRRDSTKTDSIKRDDDIMKDVNDLINSLNK